MFNKKPKTKEELEQELAMLKAKVAENQEMARLQDEISRIKHPILYGFCDKVNGLGNSIANAKTNVKKKMFP